MLVLAAVLSTMHFEGDVTADGGDYATVDFPVPAGTKEIRVAHTDGSDAVILDWGVWAPEGWRGWGGGLTDDAIVGETQSSRGYVAGTITAGTWQVVVGKAKLLNGAGHYSIDVTCSDINDSVPIQAKAEWTPVVKSTVKRWYKGDFHVHSIESGDAHASLQDDIDLATMQGLDFVNMSDHNTISQHAYIAAQQANWGPLVLRGAEMTTYSGHANAVGISQYVDHRLGYNGRTIADVVADVRAQGGIVIVNHPATDLGDVCIGCAWMHEADAPWDDISAMEMLTAGYTLGIQLFTPHVLALWDRLEDAGHRIAAVGGSDDHTAGLDETNVGAPIGSPCTLVLADELSEAGIIAGVKARHTIVQLSGPMDPVVDFSVAAPDGTVAGIGDELAPTLTNFHMDIHVTGGDATIVNVYRDGLKANAQAIPVSGMDTMLAFDDVPTAGAHRYRVELTDGAGARLVITSHIYIHASGAPATDGSSTSSGGGGGCATSSPASPASLLLALGFAPLAYRRKRRTTAAK
ncbi:MAG TPA: CehA/McbA family metallohydrolase [Kofleriaceae bacterium]|jgi:hypothetical protein